ncbi:hypothetical protein ES702_07442 [subsurface metagenome]
MRKTKRQLNGRPDISDLRWEASRRNASCQRENDALKADPEWAAEGGSQKSGWGMWNNRYCIFAEKYGFDSIKAYRREPLDLNKPWHEFPQGPPVHRLKPPTPVKATAYLPNTSGPVSKFHFEVIDKNPSWHEYRDTYLWVRIDPTGDMKTISRQIIECKAEFKKTNRKFAERIKWLEITDLIEKVNPDPDKETFIKAFPRLQRAGLVSASSKPSRINIAHLKERYCKGKILIGTPASDLLREVTPGEVDGCMKELNLYDDLYTN